MKFINIFLFGTIIFQTISCTQKQPISNQNKLDLKENQTIEISEKLQKANFDSNENNTSEEFFGFLIEYDNLVEEAIKKDPSNDGVLTGIYVKLKNTISIKGVDRFNQKLLTEVYYYPEFYGEYSKNDTYITDKLTISPIRIVSSSQSALGRSITMPEESNILGLLTENQIQFLDEFFEYERINDRPQSGIEEIKYRKKLLYDFSYYNWRNIQKLVPPQNSESSKVLIFSGSKITGGHGLNDIDRDHFTLKIQFAYGDDNIDENIDYLPLIGLPEFDTLHFNFVNKSFLNLYLASSINPSNSPPGTAFGIPCPPDWYPPDLQ